jgi:hypothetical protein
MNGGYRRLVDSSLDWGQELGNLKRWIDGHRADVPENVYVSYFGSTPPSSYGLEASWLPGYFRIEFLEPKSRFAKELSLEAGVYCISATSLQCVYNSSFPGPWRDDYEQQYRLLDDLFLAYSENRGKQAELDALLARTGLPNWGKAFLLFESARFGRLCEYLRRREPDDHVNHAILIYRLSADEIRDALFRPPVEHFPEPGSPYDNVPY